MSGQAIEKVATATASDASTVLVPASSGYAFPPEWLPHARCFLIWPFNPRVFRASGAPAQAAFVNFVNALVEFEPVTVCCPNEDEMKKAREQLKDKVEVLLIPTNDSWARDFAPSFLTRTSTTDSSTSLSPSSAVSGIAWQFNGYGGEHKGWFVGDSPYALDNQFARNLLTHLHISPIFECPIVLEGGSFHVDGEGTCLVTEQCLLNDNRKLNSNEVRDVATMDRILCQYLGVSKVIWLGQGVYGDADTDGHIDNLACFVRPGEVALAWTDDASDPQYEVSQDALRRLTAATDARGRRFTIHKLHIPRQPLTVTREEQESYATSADDETPMREIGQRLPASYANYYLANNAVFVPAFDQPKSDDAAKEVLQKLYPERTVLLIPSREILLGGGNLHCITQQQPAACCNNDRTPNNEVNTCK